MEWACLDDLVGWDQFLPGSFIYAVRAWETEPKRRDTEIDLAALH